MTGGYADPRLPARFWNKVQPLANGCWEWVAARTRDGYGRYWVNPSHVLAHRWAYEKLTGPIPTGLESDHLCRNRACVNPAHIEPVTRRENLLRGDTVAAWWLGQRLD